MPNAAFHVQGPSRMFIPGAQFRYTRKDWKEIALRAGVFTRIVRSTEGISNDALVFSSLFEYQDFILGLSYDVSTSNIALANSGRGSFELSLQYKSPNTRYRNPLKCPKF